MDAAASWHGGRERASVLGHTYTLGGSLISKYIFRGTGTQAAATSARPPVQTAAHAFTCDRLAGSAVQTCTHMCMFAHFFEATVTCTHTHTNANTHKKKKARQSAPTHQRSF